MGSEKIIWIISKKYVYQSIVKVISKNEESFTVENYIDKSTILHEVKDFIKDSFKGTMLSMWNIRDYNSYDELFDHSFVSESITKNDKELLAGNLIVAYKKLYEYRNRCAHNFSSSQQNLPTLRELASDEYKYENYYVRFSILLVIDRVFIELYRKFSEIYGC